MPKFIDCNYPGVIYEGTETQYDGLSWQGGCPMWVSDATTFKLMQTPVSLDDPEPWEYKSAPAFWADNDGKPL